MKIRKFGLAMVVAMGMGSIAPAYATIIDQGGTTLDTATGYEWLDMSFTTGQSYDYAVGSVADTVFGGGWVVATYDEVLTFWSNITGITSWPIKSWETSLAGAGTAVASFVGNTYDIIQYDGARQTHVIGWHSGLIGVDEFYTEALGLITNEVWSPGQGYVYTYGPGYKSSSRTDIGTWLVRGDNIRPQAPSGDIDPESVPEPSQAALLIAGLFGIGLISRRQSRIARKRP